MTKHLKSSSGKNAIFACSKCVITELPAIKFFSFIVATHSVLSSKITVLFLLKEYMVHGLGESSEGFLCRLFMANVVEKCKRMAFTADTTQCGN